LRSRAVEYRTHVCEYVLFLVLTLLVCADVDLMRFLISRKGPGGAEFLRLLAGYTAVWLLALPVRALVGGVARLREQKNSEQGAGVTGQEAVQSS
jgi:hypothetical protein